MNEKRWIPSSALTALETQTVAELAEAIHVSPFLATLLVQRGIHTFEQARTFFRPELSHLHDPFLMKDMDKAVQRLIRALDSQEKILIYGDYDVDGTTSVTLVYDFLSTFYPHLDYYIPDRYTEGYGVSTQGIDWAAAHGYSLIIALDCGIKSLDKVDYANSLGIDFIICDHHRPGDQLPQAAAVLDPKRSDCAYPYKELTGCGVGFKLMQAFCIQTGRKPEELYPYTDLLVVSIAADIVPITGENRVLAFFGLQHLNATPRIGLKALIKIAGLHSKLDITNVVFGLGPRINAAGRIKHAKEAVRLLLCQDEEEATEFAMGINTHNNDRRTFDSSITEEALAMIQTDEWLVAAKSTVLFKEDWHKGVIGIVASRCIEHFHRPTIILTKSNGKAAGSARSVPGFDVYEAIEECAELLEQFGGHTFAAGLTLPVENIDAFRLRFEEIVSSRILPEQLIPMIRVDLEIALDEISWKFYNVMKQMAPFGPGNMTPVFVSRAVQLAGRPTIMKEKHIKFDVFQGKSPAFTTIAFGMAHLLPDLTSGKPFDICYTLEENNFRDSRTLQFMLKDIKFQ
ncbi:single-stranded-DNA-specific exonuclease RecJ [Arundinibacter roseus]|uniref:Single-stranded-DNA-specific exonuclease RecJ n=1 Tax=Arundinibacter roseus TaxID=2070510 RepID=A0A4R4KMF6_9BACT|nr:single-stranded-DNA-specific exonuclease RecJ [Arundinibacter roseus]TDB69183.1 single-stranded-DNA-specific exonuclease RecJ [Arundinibacter roseus]